MCVAIWKPAGSLITTEVLNNCYRSNKDGCGFAYLKPKGKGNELKVYKTLSYEVFKEKLREHEERYPTSPMLIHFRAASKGHISLHNCHPFVIDNKHAFIHNGTIGKAPADPAGSKSDTSMFNETMLQLLPKGWFGNPGVKTLVEEYIGFSKLAVMDNKGECEIFNEEKGHWVGEIWYSNDQYKTPIVYKQPVNTNRQSKKDKKKNKQNNNDVIFGEDGEYDDNVDYTKFCNAENAFHGQSWWNKNANRYEKFNYYNSRWIPLPQWDKEFLLRPLTSDDAPGNDGPGYEMKSEEINIAAANADVPKEIREFTLKLTDLSGKQQTVEFARCEFCWHPFYKKDLILADLVDAEGVSYELCDECHHNMWNHGAIEGSDV